MVAPVQGSIGKSSTAPETQDYLSELTNFYNKPENEGKESEFVAPNGSKYKIQDASYLATVRSNVNTGKLDASPVAASNPANASKDDSSNKTLSKNANTEIGSYAADKKAKADKNSSNEQVNPDEAKNSGGNALSKGPNAMQDSGAQLDKLAAKEPIVEAKINKAKTETAKNQQETKELFQKMDADNVKIAKISKEITAKTQQKFHKAVQARRAKMEAKAEQAAAALEEDSTTQSGAKMGFEGKLMTTAGSSSGGNAGNDAAQQKAWEDTMKGKIDVSTKAVQAEEPKLANAKAAGEKAAQPLLEQASASDASASDAHYNGIDARQDGTVQDVVEGVAIGASTIDTIKGIAKVATGVSMNAAPPYTAGTPTIIKGVLAIVMGVIGIAVGIVSLVKNIQNTNKTCGNLDKQSDSLEKQADTQRTQAAVARRNAVAQTQASNAKILKADQALNKASQECSAGLSSSEMPAINTDGMDKDQLETVKKERYDQIMQHEQAHAAIIGGTPVIETDANGVAVGGYVAIEVPSVDESDLEGTIEKAQKVIDAALAPSNPSSQDQSVASRAKDVLSKAQDKLKEKTENAEKEGKEKPEEAKTEQPKANEVKPELQTKAA